MDRPIAENLEVESPDVEALTARSPGKGARSPRRVLAILAVAQLMVLQVHAQEQPMTVAAVYEGRASDDVIYAFEVKGIRRTFRCGFCPLYFRDITRGAPMELRIHRAAILSITLPDGTVMDEKTARPKKVLWIFKVLLFVGLPLLLLNQVTKRRHREKKRYKGA